MKASDSATSLTQLTVCDTGCQFCSEGADLEAGKELVDSKTFLSCGCRFATHVVCWTQYIDTHITGSDQERPLCPLCKAPVSPWRRNVTVVDMAAEELKRAKDHRSSMRILVIFSIAVVVLIVFIVGMMFGGKSS